MEVSLDNQRLITGSRDQSLKVWDIRTGKCLKTLSPGRTCVLCMKTTHRLDEIVCGSANSFINMWDIEKGICIGVLQGHTGPVFCIELLASNDMLVSGSLDTTVKIWSLESQRCLRTLKGHRKEVRCLAWISDHYFASGSLDMTVRIWNGLDGECMNIINIDSGFVLDMKLDPWSNTLIICSSKIQIWDLDTLECVQTMCRGKSLTYKAIELLPDGKIVVMSNLNEIEIWDAENGELLDVHTIPSIQVNRPSCIRVFWPVKPLY